MNITGGIYKGRKIIAPDKNVSRPTLSKTRMAVFNSLYSMLGTFENKSFLDVFGGSGIIGIEALSRGFRDVTVYEMNLSSARIIKKNYETLGLHADLIIGDSVKLIKNAKKFYDVVYIDPPYASNLYECILKNLNNCIAVVESDLKVNLSAYNIINQKSYGSSLITYVKT